MLPVVAIAVLLVAVILVSALVALPVLLVWSWVARQRAGSGPGLFERAKERSRRAGAVRPVPLPSGAELLVLPGWRRSGSAGWLRTVPLAVVALPAATRSLWPGSLVWAGVLALLVVLSMQWAAGSVAARWLRRALYLVLVLGLSHALLGWPAAPTGDRRVLGALGRSPFSPRSLRWTGDARCRTRSPAGCSACGGCSS